MHLTSVSAHTEGPREFLSTGAISFGELKKGLRRARGLPKGSKQVLPRVEALFEGQKKVQLTVAALFEAPKKINSW